MIAGNIGRWATEARFFHPVFAAAFAFLTDGALERLPIGRYPIAGDDIFAVVQTARTEPAQERRFELHRNYLDIQAVIRGQEIQGYYSLPPVGDAGVAGAAGMPAASAPAGGTVRHAHTPESSACLPPRLLEDRLDADDVAFYSHPAQAQRILLYPGLYVVYLPFEPHCPLCAVNDTPEDILKVVVKVRKRCCADE